MDAGGVADLVGRRGFQPRLRAYKARLPECQCDMKHGAFLGRRGFQPRLRAYKARLPEPRVCYKARLPGLGSAT